MLKWALLIDTQKQQPFVNGGDVDYWLTVSKSHTYVVKKSLPVMHSRSIMKESLQVIFHCFEEVDTLIPRQTSVGGQVDNVTKSIYIITIIMRRL